MELKGFIGGSYEGRSVDFNAQRCVNFYVEMDKTAKSPASLVGVPGHFVFATFGASIIRGMLPFNGKLYVVADNNLYSFTSDGTISSVLGTLNTSSGRIGMAHNGTNNVGGNQLMITDGVAGYIFNIVTSVFTKLTESTHGFSSTGADNVAFLDGYFVCNVGGGNSASVLASEPYNGLSWNVLSISTADADPDNLVTVFVNERELWLMGETTIEQWYDVATYPFPFQRIPGGVIEHGLAARWSVAKSSSGLIWLAKNKTGQGYVLIGNSNNAKKISTVGLEYRWAHYPTIDDAFAFVYLYEGHEFYVLTFPDENATFVYDVSTDIWHERSSYVSDKYEINRWVANSYAFFSGKHLIGDYIDGDIYQLSSNEYTENGNPIVAMRRTRHISNDMKNLVIHRLQVDMETGVGDGTSLPVTNSANVGGTAISGVFQSNFILPNDGGAVNPQACLRWSDDGGHTWSSEHMASIGRKGNYATPVVWRRLGVSRDRIFEITISDNVKKNIIGAHIEVTEGKI